METKSYSIIKPNSDSDIELYYGKDKEEIRELRYGASNQYSRIIPTESSDYHNFMMEKDWLGIKDFNNRIDQTKQTVNLAFNREDDIPIRKFELTVNGYPNDPRYTYTSKINRLNLDEERIKDFQRGKGIRILRSQTVKKDIKDPNSIYSPLFGPTFDDVSSYGTRYSCQCGMTKGQQNQDTVCPFCGHKVVKKADDFSIFGWIVLDDDWIIHPGLYKSLQFFIGQTNLEAILKIEDPKDENGYSMKKVISEKNPYVDYGIIGFREHFDEIMSFFLNKNPSKKEYYDDIMRDRDKVFTHSIPVYTTLLRPYHLIGDKFTFEDNNKYFNIMAMLGSLLNNKDMIRSKRNKKTRNQLLYDLQFNLDEIYNEVLKVMSSKKGTIRGLYGGRYNFTCRSVIVPNWKLRSDQIKVPFKALVKLLEHSIINILHNSYGMSMSQAKTNWARAYESYDQRIWDIVNNIINATEQGIPFLINRNPKP